MIFEFAGLPGCGKSTIWREASLVLKNSGIRVESLRSHSRRSMVERRKTIRFLRKNAERAGLYGVVKFAEQNPDTFMTLLDPDSKDTSHRMWSLELMAQLWFSGLEGHAGMAILLDEGLLHRGMSCLAGHSASNKVDAESFAADLNLDHGLVVVDCPVDLSVERCKLRQGGLPGGFALEGGEADPGKFQRFDSLLNAATQLLSDRGAQLIRLDATRQPDDLGRDLADWIGQRLVSIS